MFCPLPRTIRGECRGVKVNLFFRSLMWLRPPVSHIRERRGPAQPPFSYKTLTMVSISAARLKEKNRGHKRP